MVQFNEYYLPLETEVFSNFIKEKGVKVSLKKGEYFSQEGKIPDKIGWIESGAFRYLCPASNGREYNVGFSFAGEAVVDYYNFLLGNSSLVDVTAIVSSELFVITKNEFLEFQNASIENLCFIKNASELLGNQIYNRLLSLYVSTPEERYVELLKRCPHIFNILSLKEIASFLRVTPETVSHIRKKLY